MAQSVSRFLCLITNINVLGGIYFWDRPSLCGWDWIGTYSNPPASASEVLGWQVWSTTHSFCKSSLNWIHRKLLLISVSSHVITHGNYSRVSLWCFHMWQVHFDHPPHHSPLSPPTKPLLFPVAPFRFYVFSSFSGSMSLIGFAYRNLGEGFHS